VLDNNTVVQQTFPGQRASIRVSDVRMGGPKSGKVCCTTVSLSSPGVCMRVRAVRLLSTKAPFLYYIAVSSGHEYQVAMKSYKPYTSCTPSPTLPRGTNIGQRCYRVGVVCFLDGDRFSRATTVVRNAASSYRPGHRWRVGTGLGGETTAAQTLDYNYRNHTTSIW